MGVESIHTRYSHVTTGGAVKGRILLLFGGGETRETQMYKTTPSYYSHWCNFYYVPELKIIFPIFGTESSLSPLALNVTLGIYKMIASPIRRDH